MSWIDDDLDKLKKLRLRNNTVKNGAEGIFNDLWDGIVDLTKEATTKGLFVKTNGSPYERVVWASPCPNFQDKGELKITLHREREEISACGPDESIVLSIDMCDDGVVCLKYKGKRVRIEEASRLILEPFLFPELQPQSKS